MPCPIQFHPVFAARIFLDTTLPVLAAPHSLPATGFSFLHLSLLPIILPSSKIDYTLLDPRVCPTCCFRFNREESRGCDQLLLSKAPRALVFINRVARCCLGAQQNEFLFWPGSCEPSDFPFSSIVINLMCRTPPNHHVSNIF